MQFENKLSVSTPEEQGMDGNKLQAAFRLLARETERGEIPGGVALVGRHGSVVGTCAVGQSIISDKAKHSVSEDTIYDCASLTKVTATLPLILQLIDRGELRLRDPVSHYLPNFAANGKSEVNVKHLLTHTSGFQAYKDLHSNNWTAEQIRVAVLGEGLVYKSGEGYIYSDFNYITLGEIASLLFGLPLDEAARKFVFEPLGMRDTGYRPAAVLKPRIAATEFMDGDFRWGEVHDENAWAMGGVSGHAGLFSTATDLAKYAAMWMNWGRYGGGSLLSSAVVVAATRSYTGGLLNANRGLGWVLKDDFWDASGDLFSPQAFGHTGFTGTSLWMDPSSGIFAVLLTNRVHFGRKKSVASLRDYFHNAVAAAVIDQCIARHSCF